MEKNKLNEIIKNHGLKNTKIRRKILEILSQKHHILKNASEINKEIKANKSSIYRELKTLLKKNIIQEIDLNERKKFYELSFLKHHHHLICTKCKSINEFYLEKDLIKIEKLIEKEKSFKIQRHRIEFFGLCSKCQ